MTAPVRLLTSATIACVLAGTAGAQTTGVEQWTAPDGSRFVLAPDSTGGSPIVHWVVVVPTSLDEDPLGALGLSRAVVRASLNGTWAHGSKAPDEERAALLELDAAEAEAWAARGLGADLPSSVRARLDAARRRAQELGDPRAWRSTVTRAPASEPHLHEVPGASLLHVAAPASSLPQVAVLLHDWRENAALRGLPAVLARSSAESADAGKTAAAQLRREVLGTTYLGAAAARAVEGPVSHVAYADARRQLERIVQPRRTLHVLSGTFDKDTMRELLTAVFARTSLPNTAGPAALTATSARARRSVIRAPGSEQGVALAWELPEHATAMELDAVVELVSGGADSILQRALARLGPAELVVEAPFPPTARPGLVLVQAVAGPGGPTAEALQTMLLEELGTAAAQLDDATLERVAQRVLDRRIVRTSGARAAAFALAVECGVMGRAPDAVIPNGTAPAPQRIREMVEEIFRNDPGCTVALTPAR